MMTCPVGPVELSPQAGQCHPAELSLTVEVDQGVCHAHQDVTHVTRGRGQLEVLYGARCRQVEVLSQQLQASREEGERQMRVLRHEKVCVGVGVVTVQRKLSFFNREPCKYTLAPFPEPAGGAAG